MKEINNPFEYINRVNRQLYLAQDQTSLKKRYAAEKASRSFQNLIITADSDRRLRDTLYMNEAPLLRGAQYLAELLSDVDEGEVRTGVNRFRAKLPNLENGRLEAVVDRTLQRLKTTYNANKRRFSI